MKRMTMMICLVALSLAMLLTGCSGSAFTITSIGSKTTIEVNSAARGSESESQPISVGKNQSVSIEPSLDKGQMEIEFVEATVKTGTDDAFDEVTLGNVFTTVPVIPGALATVALDEGDYVLRIKTIEETSGTIVVNVVNN